MILTFSDSPNIDELTFKRLLLLGNELIFVDRPSIQLAENYGTVGIPSSLRNLTNEFIGSPVKLIVDEPPNSVFNSEFYRKYFEKDLSNPAFLSTIFEGIKNHWIYDELFDTESKRTSGEFKNYREWLLANQEMITNLDIQSIVRPKSLFEINSKDEALFKFKIIAAEESLRVTSVIHVSNKYNSSPVSINPFLNKLIALRLSNNIYTGKTIKTRQLGLKLIDCIIPDEALMQIPWKDLLDYRERTKEYYKNWIIEINKLETTIFQDNLLITDQDIINLFDANINPRLGELENELRRVRDDRFKSIMKTIKNTMLSSIAVGTLSPLSIPGAIASFIGANLKTPQLTDDIINEHFNLKDKEMSNGLTYLLKLRELT